STKPSIDKSFQGIKCLTMQDSARMEDRLLELLGEPVLEAHFEEEEEEEELHLEHACSEKEKGKLVYVIDGEYLEILDVSHSLGIREAVDSADTRVCAYHEPLKMKRVNI
ncbi:hypothetical protein KI387_039746, partial [Taxus chinensis]